MTTRYEGDGLDSSISFGNQIIRPDIKEVKDLFLFIMHNNTSVILPDDNQFDYPDYFEMATREQVRDLILFIIDNNKDVRLPLQGRVTVNRLRKEIEHDSNIGN